jgi:predicted RNA methylase
MWRPTQRKQGTFEPSFHREMLADRSRVEPFKRAIEQVVQDGDVVLDVGTGSGIMALLASEKASRVYTVERMGNIADFAEANFQRNANAHKFLPIIRKRAQDLTQDDIPEKVDVVICELLQTWLIEEYQVPVINSVLRFLKEDGDLIPSKVMNVATLVNIPLNKHGVRWQLILGGNNIHQWIPMVKLSESRLVSEINLKQENPINMHVSEVMRIVCPGVANALYLESYARLAPHISVGPAPTLFCPYFVPSPEDVPVMDGDLVRFSISYAHAQPWENLQVQFSKEN